VKTNLTAEEHRNGARLCREVSDFMTDDYGWRRQWRLKAQWHERRAAEKLLNGHMPSNMQVRLRNENDVLGLIRQPTCWHTFTDADFREDMR
jgi:hypothetical protein